MNVLKRRALILTLLVLCLFGLTILGASAAVDTAATGTTTQETGSVASATVTVGTAEPQVYYYTSLATAIAEADDGSTVTVLANTSLDSAITIDKPIAITAANADCVLTIGKKVTIADGGHLTLSSLSFKWALNHTIVVYGGGTLTITGTETAPTMGVAAAASSYHFIQTYSDANETTTVNITGYVTLDTQGYKAVKNTAATNAGTLVLNVAGADNTKSVSIAAGTAFDIQGSETANFEYSIKNASLTASTAFYVSLKNATDADAAKVTLENIALSVSKKFNLSDANVAAPFLTDDETAVTLGYLARIGNTEGGNVGTVYYSNVADAIAAAKTGDSVSLLSATGITGKITLGDGYVTLSDFADATAADMFAVDLGYTVRYGEFNKTGMVYGTTITTALIGNATELTVYVLADFTHSKDVYIGQTAHISLTLQGLDLDGDGVYPKITHTCNRGFRIYGASDLTLRDLNMSSTARYIQCYEAGTATNPINIVFDNAQITTKCTNGEDWLHLCQAYVHFTLTETSSITATYPSRSQKQNLFTANAANLILDFYGDITLTSSNISDTSYQTYIVYSTNASHIINVHKDASIVFNADTTKHNTAAFNTPGVVNFYGIQDVASADALAVSLDLFVRLGDFADNAFSYTSTFNQNAVDNVTANATKQGVLTILCDLKQSGAIKLGDGEDDANFKTYDLIIEGVKLSNGKYSTLTALGSADGIKLYDGSDVTFRNITVSANHRWIRVINTKGSSNSCDIIFGENATALMNTSSSGTEDFIYANNASYANFTVDEKATIQMTQTAAGGRKTVLAFNGAYGTVTIRGTINANITTLDSATNIILFQMGSSSGHIIIESTAVINYNFGDFGTHYFVKDTSITVVDAAAKINGAVLNDTTAKALGFNVRNNAADGTPAFYGINIGKPAYLYAGAVSTFTLLDDANVYIYETIKNKDITITSTENNKFTLTLPLGYGAFNLGENSKLTLTNLTVDLTPATTANKDNGRFARIDDTSEIVFGSGCTVECTAYIFIYNNGNGKPGGYAYTIDFQKDSVINATGALSNGLIYHNSSKAAGADVTVKIAGTINVPTASPITKDVDLNGKYTVYYDAKNATVTCGASTWFLEHTTVYFENMTTAEADAKALEIGLKVRVGSDTSMGYCVNLSDALSVAKDGDTIYILTDVAVSTGFVLDNKTLTIVGLNGAELTSSASRLFTLTNGANLTIKDLKINTTTSSTTVATAGTILAFDDATATAKCFATLTNVEVTAAGVPFYFGGESVIDLTITGGSYSGCGMFAFGVAAAEFTDTINYDENGNPIKNSDGKVTGFDVLFNGTANITITGTSAANVQLTRTGAAGQDTRSLIFVNKANATTKDLIKFTLDHVTVNSDSKGYCIYLRGSNAITLDVKNSELKSGGSTILSGQGSCAWFADFENTKFTSTRSGTQAFRPYGKAGAGSYMNFKNCEFDIKATLAFSSAIAVTMTDTTIKYGGSTALLTGASTGSTAVLTNCTYTSSTNALLAGNITTTLVNVSFKDEATAIANKAVARIGSDVTKGYYSDFATAVAAAKTGDTIYVLANATCPALTIDGKSLTIIGSNNATLTSTGTNILTGGAALTIEDLNVSNPDATFMRLDNGTLTFTGKTVKSTVTGKIFTTIGGKGTVNVSNATMTSTYLTHILKTAEGPVNVNATNVDFKGTLTRAINNEGGSTKAPKVTATFENVNVANCIMLLEFAGGALSTESVFTLKNVIVTATDRIFSSSSNCSLGTVIIENCEFTDPSEHVLRLYGTTKYIAKNSTFKSTATSGNGVLYIAASTVSGEFTNCTFIASGTNPCVKVTPVTRVTFDGCTFTHTDATKIVSTNTNAAVIVKNNCMVNGKAIDDATAGKGGLVARIGNTYYNSLLTAVAEAADGDTIVLVGNASVGTAFAVTGKSVTVTANAGVTLTITKSISIGNGATMIFDGVTISGEGNNAEAPFVMAATTSTGTLKLINSTATAAADLIHVGGSNAVLADIVIDNSTLNVTKDTTLDYRNANEGTRVNFTVQNKTVWNGSAGVYTYNAKGLINVTFEDSTFTGGNTFNIASLAQPADGKGLTDAEGKGNYALAITAKNITVTTSGYFLKLDGTACVGNVSLNIIGTKTGTGASAVHSNVINGAFAQLAAANDRVQIRATGLKVEGATYSAVYMIGSTNTIDMEFEGVTFTTTGNNARTFNSESSATHTNLIVKIKDSNVTAGDKSTYSNEINAKQIGFLLRGFKNVTIELTGVIGNNITANAGSFIDVQTPTTANAANGVNITLTDVAVTAFSRTVSNNSLACDVNVTATNLSATTGALFVSSGTSHTMYATVSNSTFTKGDVSVAIDGSYTITGSTATLANVANPDRVVELALTAFSLRIAAIDAKGTTYYPTLNQALVDLATANATKQGTIYIVRNITQASAIILGDGTDSLSFNDKDKDGKKESGEDYIYTEGFKPYDLIIEGVVMSNGAYPTFTPANGPKSADHIQLYDASSLEFRNITIAASGRWIRIINTYADAEHEATVIFGENSTVLVNTASTANEDVIFANPKSYANIIFEETSVLRMTQTAASGRKSVIAFNGAYGDVIIRGTIDANITTKNDATDIILFVMGSSSGHIIIESSAVINYNFGDYGTHYFISGTGLAVIEPAAKINGAVLNDTTAKAIGFKLRANADDGTLLLYANTTFNHVYDRLADVSTLTLLGNINGYSMGSDANPISKKITITSVAGQTFTVTTKQDIPFYMGTGGDLTLANVIYDLQGRFGRVDGSANITFADGAIVYCDANIFIYNNGQAGALNAVCTFDFQAGSEIYATKAFGYGGMICNYNSGSAGGVFTVKIAGKIQLDAATYIVGDRDRNATYHIYYDASTADVTVGQDLWFNNIFYQRGTAAPADIVWATGFKSHADADAWAVKHLDASARTYNADPNAEWEYSFVNSTAFTEFMTNPMTTYGGEIMIFKSLTNMWATRKWSFGGTLTIKAYTPGISFFENDNAYRIQVSNGTTIILDGIEVKTDGATFQLAGGTAEKHTALKLINGAKISHNLGGSKNYPTLISFKDADCAYVDLYVDETSSISVTGTLKDTASTDPNSAIDLIYVNAGWSGTITIKGTLSNTAAGEGTVDLIHIGGANCSGNIVIDGGTLNLANTKGTECYAINVSVPSYTGKIDVKGATLSNTAKCTGMTALIRVVNGTTPINIWAEGSSFTYASTSTNEHNRAIIGGGKISFMDRTFDEASTLALELGVALRANNGYYNSFASAIADLSEGAEAIIYVLQDALIYGEATVGSRTLTVKSDPAAGTDYYTVTSGSIGGSPIFAVGEGTHLILDNITFVAGRFIRIDPVTTAGAPVVIELNSGATAITADPAKDPHFIYSNPGHTIEFALTININTGAKMSRPAHSWTKGTCYMINLTNAPLAAGSAINVAGTMEDLINFTSTVPDDVRRSNLILATDADLTVNVTSGAVINFNAANHSINQYQGMFNTTGVVNISGGAFNIYGDTEAAAVFWVNKTSVYNFSGTIVFNAPGLREFFYSYGTDVKVNFNNVTLITNVSDSIKLGFNTNTPAITVVNSTFSSEAVANLFNATVTLDNGNGLSGRYDLASAIALVESGATVYLHANSVIASTIVLDGKAVTIAPMGDEAMTLALYSQNIGKMFVLKNGASLSLSNLNVTITVTTPAGYRTTTNTEFEDVNKLTNVIGTFLTVDGAEGSAQVVVVLNNVNLNAPNSQPFYFAGYSDTALTINGGSYVGGRGLFSVGTYMEKVVGNGTSDKPQVPSASCPASAKLNLTVTGTAEQHVTLTNNGSTGEASCVFYLNNKLGKDSVVVNLDYVDITSNSQWGIYLRGNATGTSALTLNYNHGTFKNTNNAWLFGSQGGTAWYVNFTDVVLDGGATTCAAGAIRPYGASGSYMNFTDCELNFKHSLSFNENLAVTMTNTVINYTDNAPIFVPAKLCATYIVLDGCTLNTTCQIASANCNVMVKGATKVLDGEELVAITAEKALAMGFVLAIEGADIYATNLFTAFVAEAKAETNKILIYSDLTILASIYIDNQNITFEGVGENITITAPKGLRMFFIQGSSNVTFKTLKITADRFVAFNITEKDASATLTLAQGTHVTNLNLAADNDALIYANNVLKDENGNTVYNDPETKKSPAGVGHIVINIEAGASVITKSLSEIAPAYATISIHNGLGTTLNVWGTLQNIAQTTDGSNAQVISIKGRANNATVNIYDGAVLEGASSYGKYTGTHNGSYCGIIYFSEGTNTLNIEGGEITIHGVTGLAYTGNKATINISGNAVINNVDAQYAMFFGANQTAHITGTADAKPVINTPAKLIASGTAYAYSFFTEEEYATLAKTLGFTVLLTSSNTACTTWTDTMRDMMAAEETLYLLNDVTSSSAFRSESLTGVKLTITSYGDAKYTWTTTFSSGAYLFQVCYNTHLIIDNVIMNVGARFMRFESDGEAGGYMNVDIMGGAEIYALPAGDGNFIYYSANRVLTFNIEEGAIIQRKGDSAAGTGHLINLGGDFVEGSVVNIKGKISDITNYTGTATRTGNLFASPSANVVVNIYNTAVLEMAQTTETGKIGVSRFTPAGLVYFKNFAEDTDYDKLATSYGLALRADATATADTAYARNLSAQLMALVANNGSVYAFNNFVLSGSFTIDNKNVTIETLRDGITMTQSATITLTNDSSITVKNLAIISSTRFIDSSTVTNGNTIKLENVKITTSAGKDSDIIRVYKSKAAIEITNCEFYSTTNRVILVHATENGNVTSLKATNVKLNSALLRVGHSTAVIGSAAAPVALTDINFETIMVTGSDGKEGALSAFMYGYFGAIYADIFGGSFKGQFIYGGDNQTNTLQIRVNPTGDKTTTISTLTPSTTSQYSALIHLNPAASANVTFMFRNATLSDVGGKSALIRVMKTTNLTIYVENTTLNAHSFLNAYNYCTVTGHFDSAAEAKTFGFNVRLGENVGKGVYYYFVHHAFENAKDGDTIYLMGNANTLNVGIDDTLFTKKVHITSDGGPYTVNALSGISFYLGNGAELKFTNVIYNLTNRLARIDGSCSIIFGAGSVMNHKNTIFIYNNGQESVKGAKYTIDIQAGSTINATTALANGLIYHNGDNTEDNVITVKIAGKINMPVKSPIVKNVGYTVKDANGKSSTRYGGRYNIYFDASTADITVGQDLWFANVFRGNVDGAMADDVLWATGFKSHADADEFGYKHVGAYFRTYDANPEAEYEYSFVLHTQFVEVITGHLTSYGGEVMILRSTQSVYSTRHFDFGGVLTFKSYNGAYFGAQDGAYRFRIKNGTTIILDGVEFRTKGAAFMFHKGTAANPSELKLINGAKITSTGNIAGATMLSFNDKDCAYTNLYVDETSSITLSGANTGSLNMIYVNAGWSGTMEIKGTLTTTAAPTGYVVLINVGGADCSGNIIIDGATINLANTKGTEAVMIDADASNYTGTITLKNATLNNTAVCTGTTAFVRTGEKVNIEIYANGLTANYKPNTTNKYSAPFLGTGFVYFKDVTGAEADAMAVKLGTGVRYGNVYSAALSTRMVNLIPVGGSGEIYFLCPAYVPTHITILNRHVTLVGVENNTAYNYFYTPTANYMFYIQNVGSLIFKNMNITGARPLINYQAIDTATVAQADRDILISFISSNVKITGSSVLINSGGHHGNVANKICDTITVNIDKNSTIDYTANSSGETADIYCFGFNHNTHPIVNLNIEGTMKFASVGATVRDVFFIRDNNPHTTTVNITETANVTLRVTSKLVGDKYFASATGGSETSNKMNIHLDAITDENGLTIDNFTMFSLYKATNMYDLCITATTDKWTAELQKLISKSAGTAVGAIAAYTEVNGTYYYSSIIGNALISKITDEATVYVLNDAATGREIALDGVKVIFKSFGDKIYTVTSNYIGVSPIFKVLGDVHMVFENVTFVAGRFARIDNVTKVDAFFTLDVNKGASLIASNPAKDPNFFYGSTTTDRLVTININAGGYVGRPAYDWASGTAFIFNLESLKMAPGSSVNIAGTLEDLINFTATSGARKSTLLQARLDSDLTVNILPGAVLNYNGNRHSVNQGQGMINVAGKLNISGGTINVSGTAEVLPIFWLNTGASMTVTGEVTINAPAVKQLCYTYSAPITITVDGATILGTVANNASVTSTTNYPTLKVIDATFGNENLASMFGGTAIVGAMDATNPLAHRYDFSSAIKLALSKGIKLVTITGNTVMNEGIVLNGQTLQIVGAADFVPTVSSTVLKAFTLKNGATLEIDNISFVITGNTVDRKVETAGVFITVDETTPNGAVNVLLNNVNVTTANGITFYFGGNSIVNLTINGGSYTGEGMFAIGYTCTESATGKGDGVDVFSNATVRVTITGTHDKHVVVKRTTGGDQNSIIFVNQTGTALENKDKVIFTMTHVDLDSSATSYPMYLRTKAALTVNYTCGKMSSTAWLFASQSNCAFYANFTDVDMTSTRTSYIARPYGAAGSGSYINITGGTITGTKVKATEYMLSFNNDIDVTITGVKIVNPNGAPIFGTETQTGLSITISDLDISEAGALVHATKAPVLHNNGIVMENDAAAIAKGLVFRVGPEGSKYFHSLASAIAAVADGGVVYVLANSTEPSSDIALNKYVTFELVNAPAGGYTITHTGTGNLFLVTDSTEAAPARLVISNMKFVSTTASGAIFAVAGNGYAIIELTNCEVSTTKGGVFNFSGKSSAVVTINGGYFKAYYRPFYTVEESAVQFTASDATFEGLGAGNDGTIFFFDNTNGNTGAVAFSFTDCKIFNTTSSGHGIYGMNTSKVDLDMTNSTINVKGWCLSSQSNTTWHANLKNVSFTTNSNNHAVRLYGAAGSYLNVEGGTFHQTGTTSTNEGVLSVGNAIVLNFFDGYIESDEIACITALTATVQINIYGGTFRYTGNKAGGAPVALPSRGMITVNGGNFITESSLGPVFSNVANSANSLVLNAFNAYGNANLITNLGAGTPTADHDAYGRTSLNTIVMTTGATPILTEGAMGLGFKASLSANAYAYLTSLAVDRVVKFGMLVIPTAELDETRFSHYGFQTSGLVEGVDYFDIKAGESDVTLADDGCVVVKLALTGISEADYNTAYSVVFYTSYDVNFELNGELVSTHNVYQYADYERSENSRSLAQVARAAYNDTSATQDSYYVNPVENTALYSHYTTEELAQLAVLCGGNTTQQTLDIFLVAGGSNAVGNTVYGDAFASAFDQNSISSNVFYSGMICDYAAQTYGATTLNFVTSKYTAIGSTPALGMGWLADSMGPEVGMAKELSKYYNSESGKYAAIMKYAFNNASIVDDADYCNNFMQMVADQIADYQSQGYKVNVVGLYWLQGEADVENVSAYATAFDAMVYNVRSNLSSITGADLSSMPVVVGEIANFLGLDTADAQSAFVTMQNTLTALNGVKVDATSKYVADANGIFVNPADVLATGERVAATLITSGTNTLDPDISAEITVPTIENTNEIYDAEGNPFTDADGNVIGFTSLVMAAAKAPAGSTIKLTADQTVYASIQFINSENVTIDGNGKVITVNGNETGIILQNANVTLNNFKLDHKGNAVGILVDATSSVVIDGNSSIIAESTAIELTGRDSMLTVKNGEFQTRSADSYSDAIIRTVSAHVTVEGGTFVAAAGGSCVYIGKVASDKLTVNIKGGTFTTVDVVAPVMTADGLQEVDANGVALTATVQAIAFVNEYVLAILVISPDAVVNSSIVSNNAGLGQN